MKKNYKCVLFLLVFAYIVGAGAILQKVDKSEFNFENLGASIAAIVKSPFSYFFSVNGYLSEAGSMNETTSPYWWLNSGGQMILSGGLGKTIQGSLPANNYWRLAYAAANPVDTDNGYHPQNLFRLISRSQWQNFTQQFSFKINKYNLSSSDQRYESNGVLLFNRYVDNNNLYYTGVRVDGAAVIKKKINGIYYTMAYKKIFDGTFNRVTNPNILPVNTWVAIKSDVRNNADGTVSIKLYVDRTNSGNWELALETKDDGKSYGTPITQKGYAGIRTDFMDVEFDNYKVI